MTTGIFRTTHEDVLAAIILMTTCAAVAAGRLDAVASRLPASLLNAWTLWWPMVLIVAGVVLLWMYKSSRARLRKATEGLSSAKGDPS